MKTYRIPAHVRATLEASARGCYQHGLISGAQNWSGSDLEGLASRYGARYAASREGLLERINSSLRHGWRASSEVVYIEGYYRRRLILMTRGTKRIDWLTTKILEA